MIAWMQDSAGWVEVYEEETITASAINRVGKLLVFRLDTPRVEEIPLKIASGIRWFTTTSQGEAVLICDSVVGNGMRMVSVPLSKIGPEKAWNIVPPTPNRSSYINQVEFSPDGKRMAWNFEEPFANPPTKSIWLSDRQGLTFEQVTPRLNSDIAPTNLHWMSNGQQLTATSGALGSAGSNQLLLIDIPSRLKLNP